VKDCNAKTKTHLLFEKLVTRFGCPRFLMSPYHPQSNGSMEVFKKILENSLTKICNVNKDD
jgi:hypothetical protein